MADNSTGMQRRRPQWPGDSDRVPVLPPGAPMLMQALQDDGLDFRAIAQVIEQVPSVAGRLLGLANSAWSAPRSPVLSIEAACSRLGLRVVRTVGIALAISHPFNPLRCPAFIAHRFWTSALLNAEMAGWLAERLLGDQVSVARTAGLLSNLGLLWLAEVMPEETDAALRDGETLPGGVNSALIDRLGFGFDQAGAWLAEAWQLPAALQAVIGEQCEPEIEVGPLCKVVSAGIRLAGAARHGETDWSADAPRLSGLDAAILVEAQSNLAGSRQRIEALAQTLFSAH